MLQPRRTNAAEVMLKETLKNYNLGTEVQISRASPAQIPEAAELHRQFLYDPSSIVGGLPAITRYYHYLLRDASSALYVATVENKVVGFACVVDRQERVLMRFLSHDIAFAVPFVVRQMFSARGIGYLLRKIRNDFLGQKWGTYSPSEESRCELRSIAVATFHRGKGVGRKLLKACIETSRNAGIREMTAWIDSTNVASRALFQSQGFKQQARLDVKEKSEWLLFVLAMCEDSSTQAAS